MELNRVTLSRMTINITFRIMILYVSILNITTLS
jgi:hypothetical protein